MELPEAVAAVGMEAQQAQAYFTSSPHPCNQILSGKFVLRPNISYLLPFNAD